MAAAAETLEIEPFFTSEVITPPQPRYFDAEASAELYLTRLSAREEAAQILEQNRELLRQGEFEEAPIPVDVLGTAKRLIKAEHVYGEDSPERQELYEGLFLDSKRLLAEAYRKNTWEYFPVAVHAYDQERQEYFSNGQSMLEIVAGGLSPIAEKEEMERRVNEFVEEKTYQAIGRMCLEETINVTTISECPDWATEAYAKDSKGAHGGYVPAINKLMIRGVNFSPDGTRREEQLGLSGIFITHEIISEILEQTGRLNDSAMLDKTTLHGKQLIDVEQGDVIDLAALLDKKATEHFGKNIFMGEEVSAEHPKDYSAIKNQSVLRQQNQIQDSRRLTDYIIELEKNGTDRWAAKALVDKFVKDLLLSEACHNPKKAAEIFDTHTAEGFREVARLESMGEHQRAWILLQEVEKQAPAASFCGAGSCGLEAVNPGSKDTHIAKELLKTASEKDMVYDKARACPECGVKAIFYNVKTGDKACSDCRVSEIGGKSSKPSKGKK